MSLDQGLKLYTMHKAMSLHFAKNSSYDFVKYHGSVNVDPKKFYSDPMRWSYQRQAEKHKDQLAFVLYQAFKYNKFQYVDSQTLFRTINRLDSLKSLDLQSFHRKIADEILSLMSDYSLFSSGKLYPVIYEMYMEDKVSLEAMLIINTHVHRFLKLESSIDIISWPDVVENLTKQSKIVDVVVDIYLLNMYLNKNA